MTFVEVEIPTNETTIYAEAVAKFKELIEARGVVGWEENPADLSMIQLAVDASMAAITNQIAAVVPPAIFRKFGTEQLRIPYKEGTQATVTTKWALLEEGGEYAAHTIEAGTQLTIAGAAGTEPLAFTVKEATTIAKGESSKLVTLIAIERGTEFNGLTGVVELVNALSYVKEVTIIGETSGGVNQETDEEYQNRLNKLNETLSFLAVTALQFALKALNTPESWPNSKGETETLPAGTSIGRTTAIEGYNPATNEPEATVTNGSTELTEITSETGLTVKSEVVGTGIPKGTTLVSKTKAKEWKMSAKATATPGKKLVKIVGSFEQEKYCTVWVTNKKGSKLSTEQMEAIQDYLESIREINAVIEVLEPKYNNIQATTQIHVLPGFVTATVEANVKKAIEAFLSPETFGSPTGQSSGINSWLNITQGYSTVRYNQVLEVIGAVTGVQYVFAGSTGLAIGLEEAPGTKVEDIPLVGPAPLPETTAAKVIVTSA